MSERDESTHSTTGHTAPAEDETVTDTGADARSGAGARLARNMVFYTVIRLLLVLALTLAIIGIGLLAGVQIPVLVAAIISVVIALPLSMTLFKGLRMQINSDIAAVDENRRIKREDLRRRMNEA